MKFFSADEFRGRIEKSIEIFKDIFCFSARSKSFPGTLLNIFQILLFVNLLSFPLLSPCPTCIDFHENYLLVIPCEDTPFINVCF